MDFNKEKEKQKEKHLSTNETPSSLLSDKGKKGEKVKVHKNSAPLCD